MHKQMPDLTLLNTRTGEKEPFTPLREGEVRIYSCGPTVYDYAHIGNFRSFLMSDILARVFKYLGYTVKKVQNITDVGHLTSDADTGEDKVVKRAKAEKLDPFAITRMYEEYFVEDEQKLRILPPDSRPRASEFIEGQIRWCEDLIASGHAYASNGSVYFRLRSFPGYGQLSKNNVDDLRAGARVEENPEKEDPLDFALWRAAPENYLMKWESPWGMGFPGWHLECSVMSKELLGHPFDIHTGGEDNIFPHHECEIAQNECHGCKDHPSVNYWLHAKHLLVDGKKMSKSEGNFYTVRDLIARGWRGEEIRYLLLSAHYRTALNFTMEGLSMARSSIERLANARTALRTFAGNAEPDAAFTEELQSTFEAALRDDLNIPEALGIIFGAVSSALRDKEAGTLTPERAHALLLFLERDFDMIFDVFPDVPEFTPEENASIAKQVQERQACREAKDFLGADRIRNTLLEEGIILLDNADGTTTWQRKG